MQLSLAERVCRALPGDVARIFESHLTADLSDTQALRRQLDAYAAEAKALADRDDFSDIEHALELVARCRALLDAAGAEGSQAHRVVQAAIQYLVGVDDAQSDAMSIVGTEDDERVIAAVEGVLARR